MPIGFLLLLELETNFSLPKCTLLPIITAKLIAKNSVSCFSLLMHLTACVDMTKPEILLNILTTNS